MGWLFLCRFNKQKRFCFNPQQISTNFTKIHLVYLISFLVIAIIKLLVIYYFFTFPFISFIHFDKWKKQDVFILYESDLPKLYNLYSYGIDMCVLCFKIV